MTASASTGSGFRMVYPNLSNVRRRRHDERHRLPFRLALVGLVLYLLVSDNLLVSQGIPYAIPGGPFLFKLHPGTYLIALGFILLLFQGHPREQWPRLFACATAPLLFAGVVFCILIYTVIRFGPSGNAFFIDTLLMPACLATIFLQAPLRLQRLVFRLVLAVLVFNALLGILEALTEWRLVPFLIGDQPATEDFFRSSALGGHPLKNSQRTATLLIAALLLPVSKLLFLIPLLVIALLVFGGRTALALSVLLLGGWGLYYFSRQIVTRTLDPRLVLGLILLTLVIAAGVVSVTIAFGLGQRIITNLTWDSSAQSRILLFRVFDYSTAQDWLWGMGPARIDWVLDHLKGSTTLIAIENFWVVLLLQVGLAWFIPLTLTLLGMIGSLARRGPASIRWAAALFLVLASANPALATKSQDLAILVAILIGGAAEAALLKPRRPLPETDLGCGFHER